MGFIALVYEDFECDQGGKIIEIQKKALKLGEIEKGIRETELDDNKKNFLENNRLYGQNTRLKMKKVKK